MSIQQIADVKPDVQEDDVLGHKIIAAVELSQACHDFTKNDVRRVLRKQISLYKIPAKLTVC